MLLLAIATALYAITTILYLRHLFVFRPRTARLASLALEATFLVHALALAVWLGETGPSQISRLSALLPAAIWVVVVVYLVIEARFGLHLLGSLVVPLVTIGLLVCLAAAPEHPGVPEPVRNVLLTLHVGGAVLGVGALLLAAALSILYLVQERQLKRKRFGTLYQRLPSLDVLDRLAFRTITVGFPFFTMAVVLGGIRAFQGGSFGTMGPAYLPAVLAWMLYGLVLQGRLLAGWRGRRAAWLVLGGLGSSCLVLAHFVVR